VFHVQKVCAGLATLTAIAVITYVRRLSPWYLHWGATREEAEQPMPGDKLMSHPKLESPRAITIGTQTTAIWPWLVQMTGTGQVVQLHLVRKPLAQQRHRRLDDQCGADHPAIAASRGR
jgi:hypothetical protein